MTGPSFADRLLNWYDAHGRKDLPWQQQPTPYRVWVSEIMLQQTQVRTVIPYYERFVASYPDLATLASAPLDDVLHHWAGLGYYARGRNLHKAAGMVCDRFAGELPLRFEDLIELPGIGRSTAGAILALSHGTRLPILDGNVKRVLTRYHTVEGWPGRSDVANTLWELAEKHTPLARVAAYTQAIMDLGATLCTRSKPQCSSCPLTGDCGAHANGRETDFPGKRQRKTKSQKSTVMLLVHHDGRLYLRRRPATGIWGGLWSLPEISDREVLSEWCRQNLGAEVTDVVDWAPVRHSFSHFDLDILPLEVRLQSASRKVADAGDEIWYELGSPAGIGLAAPVKTLIDHLRASGTE